MDGYSARRCPVCGAEIVSIGTSARQIERESTLREAFVTQRLDHRPEELELMDLTRFMHGGPGRLLSCQACGLLFREEVRTARYDADLYDPELLRHLYPRYQRAFAEKIQYKPILRNHAEVLEIGSHLGSFLQTAEEWGWRPTGLDIGAYTSSFARRQGMSVKRLPLEDYSPRLRPDAIFIWNCFEQLDDPSAILDRSYRLLAPHGLLVVRVPNADFYRRKRKQLEQAEGSKPLRELGYNNLLGFPYLYGYTPSTLDRLLRNNGFNPVVRHNSNLLTPPYPELSARIRKEWRAIRRKTEASPESGGPWIEVVSRRLTQ